MTLCNGRRHSRSEQEPASLSHSKCRVATRAGRAPRLASVFPGSCTPRPSSDERRQDGAPDESLPGRSSRFPEAASAGIGWCPKPRTRPRALKDLRELTALGARPHPACLAERGWRRSAALRANQLEHRYLRSAGAASTGTEAEETRTWARESDSFYNDGSPVVPRPRRGKRSLVPLFLASN